MLRSKQLAVLTCASSVAAFALISTTGCGNKEEAPPTGGGYYNGTLQGKSMKSVKDPNAPAEQSGSTSGLK